MFNLHVEIAGEAVQVDAFGSALAAVRECHSMARTYAAMQDDDGTALRYCDLLFGKGVDQQVRRERFYAGSLKGRKVSKSNPAGVAPAPVSGTVGAFIFAITPAMAEMVVSETGAPTYAVEPVTV